MRQLLTLLLALSFIALCQACVHYVEEATPAGQVAEPQSVSLVPQRLQPTPYGSPTVRQTPPSVGTDAFDAQAIRDSYCQAYSPSYFRNISRPLADRIVFQGSETESESQNICQYQ